MFWNKPIDIVTSEDLREMEARGTMESQHLDFKLTLPEKLGGDGKREFLKDVISFANAEGGTLLYGVAESEDDTAQIVGLDHQSVDDLRQQLTHLIYTNIEPRLDGVLIHFIELEEEGKMVLGIDVPKSWNAPHGLRVKHATYRFYMRMNTDNIAMDTLQLREHILANYKVQDKIQSLVTSRYMDLASGHAPIPLQQSSKLIVHIVPLSAFRDQNALNMQTLYKNPPGFYHSNSRLNLNGYLLYYIDEMMGGSTYTQIYRNGVIEYVDTKIMNNQHDEKWYIPSQVMYKEINQTIESSIQFYKDQGVQTPIYVFITLQDAKKFCLPRPDYLKYQYLGKFGSPFNQNTLQLPEVLIEDFETPITPLLKAPFDALWNASGFPYCEYTMT